uniref:Uncharacterized protein n=1 Tax=uncultured marine virus TaxID=186617 RepID=A0A0F7L2N1_9VIRU|nr:hypothetical protein [uncultured marine virus]
MSFSPLFSQETVFLKNLLSSPCLAIFRESVLQPYQSALLKPQQRLIHTVLRAPLPSLFLVLL